MKILTCDAAGSLLWKLQQMERVMEKCGHCCCLGCACWTWAQQSDSFKHYALSVVFAKFAPKA